MSLDWDAYWSGRSTVVDAGVDDLLIQVGKTQFGEPVGADQLALLVGHLADTLPMGPDRDAIDLGCGNGLVTSLIAPRLRTVVGLDYSAALLDTARARNAADNITYRRADLRDASAVVLPGDGYQLAWSVEVVQNLDPESLSGLLRWLRGVMAPGFHFLASGIPDDDRIRDFYNTPDRWQHHLDLAAEGREPMGRWWTREEIAAAAADAGVAVEFRRLPEGYYTSHYRFDALFRGTP